MKFKSCNLHFSWNGDLNFNNRDVHPVFAFYNFNLFKVTSSSNDAISTAFIAISNSYDEIYKFDMDSLIFELQLVFYFQLFFSANVRHIILKTRSFTRLVCALHASVSICKTMEVK